MPPRPSRNVDQLLLEAGHALLPKSGVRNLSIRQITEHAGVNLGMFHYHFKTKDVFVRAVLQQQYNDMFAALSAEAQVTDSSVESLRRAVTVIARWGRDNRGLFVRLLGDAFSGEKVVQEFMQANMPRHLMLIVNLVQQAQKDGHLRKLPLPQAMAFLIGAVAAPILLITAATNGGLLLATLAEQFEQTALTNAAIDQRIDMALTGLAAPKKTGAKK